MEPEQVLQQLGYSDKEANVYLSLLRLNKATATQISKDTKIDRTLIYELTNRLIEKGIISYVISNHARLFFPAHPRELLGQLQDKEQNLREILPQLEKLKEEKEHSAKAEVFEGKEGLKNLLRDLLSSTGEILGVGEEGQFQRILPIEASKYVKELVKRGIHERVLVREDLKDEIIESENSEYRFLPKEYLSPTTTVIYENTVAHIVWSTPYYVILINNRELTDSFRSYFEALWQIAER